MKNTTFAILITLIVCCFSFAEDNFSGEYVNKIFLENHKTTSSPIKAALQTVKKSQHVYLKIINPNPKTFSYTAEGDFHSGTGTGFPMQKVKDKSIWKNKEFNRSIEIRRSDKNIIEVVFEGKGKETYVSIPKGFNNFINSSIAGAYVEEKTKDKFIFSHGGDLFINNKNMGKYEIRMDSVFNPNEVDVFKIQTNRNRKMLSASTHLLKLRNKEVIYFYSFIKTKNILRIYANEYEGECVLAPKNPPLYVLKEVTTGKH